MRMIDFEYNGQRLSDYGLFICSFDGSNDTQDIGNIISINKTRATKSDKYMATGYSYDDAFTIEMQVCKFSCVNESDFIMTATELNNIMRWLNRKNFYKFKPIYDNTDFEDVYYEGTFNISLIKAGKDVVGLNLTLNTNAPYGFIDSVSHSFTFNAVTDKFIISDISDEIGHCYANVTIKCLEAGDLKISNSLDTNNEVIIKNCTVDEKITLYGVEKIIETTRDSHIKLYNDFNYNFFRVVNTYENNENIYTSSLKCEITVDYSPIRKVGIVI